MGQIIYYLTRYYSSTGSAAAALIVSIKQPPLSLSVEIHKFRPAKFMHIEFYTKLNFLEGEYAITQNIGFLLS